METTAPTRAARRSVIIVSAALLALVATLIAWLVVTGRPDPSGAATPVGDDMASAAERCEIREQQFVGEVREITGTTAEAETIIDIGYEHLAELMGSGAVFASDDDPLRSTDVIVLAADLLCPVHLDAADKPAQHGH